MLRIILFLVINLLICHDIFAQKSPAKFGKLRDMDKEFSEFPEEEEANAVILFNHGYVKFIEELDIEMTVHRRIKILDESGIDEWASVSIIYPGTGSARTKITGIKAQTINIDEKGKAKSKSVSKRDFFEEELDDNYNVTKFTYPEVEVGSVLELEYTMRYQQISLLRDWNFQDEIPTVYSEFVAEIPNAYKYAYNFRGSREFDRADQEGFVGNYPITIQNQGYASQYGDRNTTTISSGQRQMFTLPATRHTWAKSMVPSLKDESYITTTKNYRDRIEFQLTAFEYETTYRNYAQTWDKIVENYYNYEEWGGKLNTIKEKADQIMEGVLLDAVPDKKEAIYRWVTQNFSMDDYNFSLYTDISTRKLLKEKKGYSSDVNLVLLGLLKANGYLASPMFVSTRAHGNIVSMFAYSRQFNHMIVAVNDGNGNYTLMDATRPYYASNVLPFYDLNQVGLIAHSPNNIEWKSLEPSTGFNRKIAVTAKIDSLGNVSGSLELSDSGYAAYETRKSLIEGDIQKWVETLFDFKEDIVTIDSSSVTNLEDYNEDIQISCTFSLNNAMIMTDGNAYFTPLMVGKSSKNPFSSEKRTMPINFGYGTSVMYSLSLELPDNMEIEELPENHMGRYKTKSSYRRLAQETPMGIQYLFSTSIKDVEVAVQDYLDFRTFYSALVDDQSDVISLKIK